MKLALGLFAFILCLATQAQELSFQSLSGKFKVTHPELAVFTLISFTSEGTVEVELNAPLRETYCQGAAQIHGEMVESVVYCDDGQTVLMRFDMENVSNFDRFTVPVFSTYFDMIIEMKFERL